MDHSTLTDIMGDIHWNVSRLKIPAVYSGETVLSEGYGGGGRALVSQEKNPLPAALSSRVCCFPTATSEVVVVIVDVVASLSLLCDSTS